MRRVASLLVAMAVAAIPAMTLAAPVTVPAKQDAQTAHAAMSDGEIKKIDKEAGKVTIKHGPLANLDMPGMTMVFRVKDAAMLDQVKVKDKVKFNAEKLNGALTVTMIEAVK